MIKITLPARSTVIIPLTIMLSLFLVGTSNANAQILSNPVIRPSTTMPTNISSILGGILNKSNSNASLTGGEERTETTQMTNFMNKELSSLNNEAASLKARISSTTFTPGSGAVINLINSAAYMKGEISALGAGQSILQSIEDLLIGKIKAAGPSAFSPAEQSYISTWVNDVMSARQNQNNYASKVLPGFEG